MKGISRFIVSSFAILFVVVFIGNGKINLQAQDPATDTTSQKIQEGLVIDWVNDFEECEDWKAEATSPLGSTDARKIPGSPKKIDGTEVFQKEIVDENKVTHKNEYVLGIKTYFYDRGFDRVEVFPPNEYIIRGKAREMRVWVLGRKFRHTLFVKLRDYRGKTHKLKVGRLDFWGWKELSVIIPGWLPQSASYALLDKNLHFVSFFVECDRYERPGTFYTYFDQFRVITDLSEFTGDLTIKDNW